MRCFKRQQLPLLDEEQEQDKCKEDEERHASSSEFPASDGSSASQSSPPRDSPPKGQSSFWTRCRMSLDSNYAKYAKVRKQAALQHLRLANAGTSFLPQIDECFTSSLSQPSSLLRLQAIVAGLVATKLTSFASVCLVSPFRGTFGVLCCTGRGSEFWPPPLAKDDDGGGGGHGFSLITSRAFPIADSNWSIEDAVDSLKPLYYDCAADAIDLPKEAVWLKRVGMHAMVTLPCVHNGAVQGVLTVGIPSFSMDHLLIRKLNELCQEVTPFVVDSNRKMRGLLAPPRSQLRRFESQNDIAAAVMDEMLGLDKAVLSRLHDERDGGGSSGMRRSEDGQQAAGGGRATQQLFCWQQQLLNQQRALQLQLKQQQQQVEASSSAARSGPQRPQTGGAPAGPTGRSSVQEARGGQQAGSQQPAQVPLPTGQAPQRLTRRDGDGRPPAPSRLQPPPGTQPVCSPQPGSFSFQPPVSPALQASPAAVASSGRPHAELAFLRPAGGGLPRGTDIQGGPVSSSSEPSSSSRGGLSAADSLLDELSAGLRLAAAPAATAVLPPPHAACRVAQQQPGGGGSGLLSCAVRSMSQNYV